MLVAVAFHLEEDASLVTATHVCHLWSHLDFANIKRALVFLERSKSVALSGEIPYLSEIIREYLDGVTTRITTSTVRNPTLDELLAQPIPVLAMTKVGYYPAELPIQCIPSLTSLVVSGFDPLLFHLPHLTFFHLTRVPYDSPPGWTTDCILDFLRGCPLLEVVFLDCGDLDAGPDSNIVSLPLLRSFTHESHGDSYRLRLFDQLSLPSTWRVVLVIDVTDHHSDLWIPHIPTPRDLSYISDIRTVTISAHSYQPENRLGSK